jgi:hypothetical protein
MHDYCLLIINSSTHFPFVADTWFVRVDWNQSNASRILDPSFISSHASRFNLYISSYNFIILPENASLFRSLLHHEMFLKSFSPMLKFKYRV